MTEAEARVILTRMRDGCDPFTGEALPENHPYASLEIVSALHIALRAMDGVSLGTQNIPKSPPMKKREKRNQSHVQIKRTETALGHSGTPWTKEDKSLLRLRLKQEASLDDIARELKRTPFEIQEKLGRKLQMIETSVPTQNKSISTEAYS